MVKISEKSVKYKKSYKDQTELPPSPFLVIIKNNLLNLRPHNLAISKMLRLRIQFRFRLKLSSRSSLKEGRFGQFIRPQKKDIFEGKAL
jgi:hypothetical protein